jgi:GNAT superfamily N-acetyltransferase
MDSWGELFLLITPELIQRVEQFHLRFGVERAQALSALPQNPFGAEVRFFGQAVALRFASPFLQSRNRVGNLTETDAHHLSAILAFYAEHHVQPMVYVPHGQMTEPLFHHLVRAGFWSGGSATVPLRASNGPVPEISQNIAIASATLEDGSIYASVWQAAFNQQHPDKQTIQTSEDTLPFCSRYIARVEGAPVGVASLMVANGIAYCGMAGTLPSWRGRGVQRALLVHRIHQARALGADFIIGGGGLFTTTHRNFERVGMRLIPLGTGWAFPQQIQAAVQ